MKILLSFILTARSRGLLFVLVAALLSACASSPTAVPTNIARMKAGTRVGVLVTGLDQSAVHEHVGTTLFNNFSNPKTLPRHLGEQTSAAIGTALTSAGYVTVPIEAEKFSVASLTSMFATSDGTWSVRPERKVDFDRLKQEMNVDAVIVVIGRRTLARLECFGGPCTERYIEKSGLFTRSVFNLNTYHAVPAFDVKLLRLDVPADLSRFDPMASIERARVKQLMGNERPDDPRTLTDAEFAVITAWIDTYVAKISQAAVATISGASPAP